MTNLKWADVAHYYQESGIDYRDDSEEGGGEVSSFNFLAALCAKDYDQTPILRHLDDLTESEARELYEIAMNEEYEGDSCIDWLSTHAHNRETCGLCEFDDIKGNPFAWHYLLSKGFDLFNLLENKEAERKAL